MNIEDIQRPIRDDFLKVNARIYQSLHSDVELISQMGQHIVESGGKRLRPILALLSAKAWGYQGTEHIDLAAIVEFIHTATLLHDDVVDASLLRRGKDTANVIWGNEATVLVGDFLYSRALEMLAEIKNIRFVEIFGRAVSDISEGEVRQLLNKHQPDISEAEYCRVIKGKTAILFGTATQIGAVISNCSRDQENCMTDFGLHVGTAFQLIDDVLDYSGTEQDIGKNLGDDLAEGKPTLPLIYAMKNGSKSQADFIRLAIREGGRDRIDDVTRIIEETGALKYTEDTALVESQRAIALLDKVPDSSYKEAMRGLATFSAQRSF